MEKEVKAYCFMVMRKCTSCACYSDQVGVTNVLPTEIQKYHYHNTVSLSYSDFNKRFIIGFECNLTGIELWFCKELLTPLPLYCIVWCGERLKTFVEFSIYG